MLEPGNALNNTPVALPSASAAGSSSQSSLQNTSARESDSSSEKHKESGETLDKYLELNLRDTIELPEHVKKSVDSLPASDLLKKLPHLQKKREPSQSHTRIFKYIVSSLIHLQRPDAVSDLYLRLEHNIGANFIAKCKKECPWHTFEPLAHPITPKLKDNYHPLIPILADMLSKVTPKFEEEVKKLTLDQLKDAIKYFNEYSKKHFAKRSNKDRYPSRMKYLVGYTMVRHNITACKLQSSVEIQYSTLNGWRTMFLKQKDKNVSSEPHVMGNQLSTLMGVDNPSASSNLEPKTSSSELYQDLRGIGSSDASSLPVQIQSKEQVIPHGKKRLVPPEFGTGASEINHRSTPCTFTLSSSQEEADGILHQQNVQSSSARKLRRLEPRPSFSQGLLPTGNQYLQATLSLPTTQKIINIKKNLQLSTAHITEVNNPPTTPKNGPLSNKQIENYVKYLDEKFPSSAHHVDDDMREEVIIFKQHCAITQENTVKKWAERIIEHEKISRLFGFFIRSLVGSDNEAISKKINELGI